MNLYMDDVRSCPDGWKVARTVEDAKLFLASGEVDDCSLDHDMGACADCTKSGASVGDMLTEETTYFFWCQHVMDGTKLVRWMVETGHWPRQKPTVHSMNTNGAKRMREIIDRYFGSPAMGPMF